MINVKKLISIVIAILLIIFILVYVFRDRKKRKNLVLNNAFLQGKREELEKYITEGMSSMPLQKLHSIVQIIILLIPIVSIIMLIYYLWQDKQDVVALLICFLLILLPPFVLAFISSRYTLRFRKKVITNVINKYNPNLEYLPTEGFSKEEYGKCHFNLGPFLNHSDNTIIEKKGTFRCADIDADNGTAPGDDATYLSPFTGKLARIDIKDVNCEIYMGDFKKKLLSKEYKSIDFGNDEFNKAFKAYTNNEEEARKLLTPDIMQQFVELKENTYGNIIIRILNDKLYIRFASLEPSFAVSMPPSRKSAIDSAISSLAVLQEVMDTIYKAKEIIESKKK